MLLNQNKGTTIYPDLKQEISIICNVTTHVYTTLQRMTSRHSCEISWIWVAQAHSSGHLQVFKISLVNGKTTLHSSFILTLTPEPLKTLIQRRIILISMHNYSSKYSLIIKKNKFSLSRKFS